MRFKLCLILLIISAVLCACAENSENTSALTVDTPANTTFYDRIQSNTGSYPEILESWPGYYHEDDIVPNKETAISIAQIIFNNIRSEGMEKFAPVSIFEDTEDNLWVIRFMDRELGPDTLDGYSCTIILNKKDGSVASIRSNIPFKPDDVWIEP